MIALLDVIALQIMPPYGLLLTFENGEQRVFDLSAEMHLQPYCRIGSAAQFALARVQHGGVVWPNQIDISPCRLYAESVPV